MSTLFAPAATTYKMYLLHKEHGVPFTQKKSPQNTKAIMFIAKKMRGDQSAPIFDLAHLPSAKFASYFEDRSAGYNTHSTLLPWEPRA